MKQGKPISTAKSRRDVGDLLKSAYDETVREDIPPEFLDLLGKLD
jgi:hypothetical protein